VVASSPPGVLRIGTRGSRLALWQAEHVRDLLRARHPDLVVEVVVVKTLGDRDQTTPLAVLGGTGVFTKEIELALAEGECDLAVHSLKDLPTRLADGFELAAVLERADPRDALITRDGQGLAELAAGSLVGTSSLRRRSQLKHLRPDLRFTDLRGNVPTRLRAVGVQLDEGKARDGEPLDATVLAMAGLERLGLAQHASEILQPEVLLPAPAQGAVGVEIRAGDRATEALVTVLDHAETRVVTQVERDFLRSFEGGCKVPIGALARRRQGGLRLEGVVGGEEGVQVYRSAVEGTEPTELGERLAAELKAQGAQAILDALLSREAVR